MPTWSPADSSALNSRLIYTRAASASVPSVPSKASVATCPQVLLFETSIYLKLLLLTWKAEGYQNQ